MPLVKPTLGYPTRRAAILALAQEGLSTSEIAAKIGTSRNSVEVALSRLRETGLLGPVEQNGNCKPTLGYSSRRQAIMALYNEGLRPSEIARRLEASRGSVTSALNTLRKKGLIGPVLRRKPLSIRVSAEAFNLLAEKAARADQTIAQFAAAMIEQALQAELIALRAASTPPPPPPPPPPAPAAPAKPAAKPVTIARLAPAPVQPRITKPSGVKAVCDDNFDAVRKGRKTWCIQCEKLRAPEEARVCRDRFCKLKAVANA